MKDIYEALNIAEDAAIRVLIQFAWEEAIINGMEDVLSIEQELEQIEAEMELGVNA
jgi:hypothetical protein